VDVLRSLEVLVKLLVDLVDHVVVLQRLGEEVFVDVLVFVLFGFELLLQRRVFLLEVFATLPQPLPLLEQLLDVADVLLALAQSLEEVALLAHVRALGSQLVFGDLEFGYFVLDVADFVFGFVNGGLNFFRAVLLLGLLLVDCGDLLQLGHHAFLDLFVQFRQFHLLYFEVPFLLVLQFEIFFLIHLSKV